MYFLANENFPRPSTLILRENGFSVNSIQEDSPGISDEEVIKIALDKNLIILTFDRDYGEIIFKYSINNPPAVVFFREKGAVPEFAALSLLICLQILTLHYSLLLLLLKKNISDSAYTTNSNRYSIVSLPAAC